MTLQVYAPAIRDAIQRAEIREMKALLIRAKQLRKQQGDIDKAITTLEKSLAKLTARKAPARRSKRSSR